MLYNKYRPRCLNQVIGQERVVDFLRHAIKKDMLPHGIIITGKRGIGKTSTARVIARILKCDVSHKNIENDSICECNTCQLIDQSSHMDVLELDAASRSNIENIREIIESTKYSASDAKNKNKVYIIDETHMLNKQCFNALLKTLEEPSRHVYFIMATTELEKIPSTVISRCVVIKMNEVKPSVIYSHLKHICEAEEIEYETGALEVISNASDGCVRDSIVALEHASIQYVKITESEMLATHKVSHSNTIEQISRNIVAGNAKAALEALDDIYDLDSSIMFNIMGFVYCEIRRSTLKGTSESGCDMAKTAHLIRVWEIMKSAYISSFSLSNKKMVLDMAVINASFASTLPLPSELLNEIASDAETFASVLECFPDAKPVSR